MPTYAFRCTECEHEFEVTQSISAPPAKSCVKCRGPVKKLFFPIGIQFKGTGFHINDYRKADAPTKTTEPAPACEVPACKTDGCAAPSATD